MEHDEDEDVQMLVGKHLAATAAENTDNEDEDEEDGKEYTCPVCYDDYTQPFMTPCTNDHPMCGFCLKQMVTTIVGDHDRSKACDMKCCDPSCTGTYSERYLKRAVPPNTMKKLEEMRASVVSVELYVVCPCTTTTDDCPLVVCFVVFFCCFLLFSNLFFGRRWKKTKTCWKQTAVYCFTAPRVPSLLCAPPTTAACSTAPTVNVECPGTTVVSLHCFRGVYSFCCC